MILEPPDVSPFPCEVELHVAGDFGIGKDLDQVAGMISDQTVFIPQLNDGRAVAK